MMSDEEAFEAIRNTFEVNFEKLGGTSCRDCAWQWFVIGMAYVGHEAVAVHSTTRGMPFDMAEETMYEIADIPAKLVASICLNSD